MLKRFTVLPKRAADRLASPEAKTATAIRIITYFVAGVIVAGGIFLALFFYKHVYITVSLSEEILLLKSQFGVESVDVGTLEKVEAWWEERNKKDTSPRLPRDPFSVT